MIRMTAAAFARANAANQNEHDFTDAVLTMAKIRGWKRMHVRPGRVIRHGQEKYETPFKADGKGWPDLFLIHRKTGRIVVAELKSVKGKPTPEQVEWLELFKLAGIHAAIWTPLMWDEIDRVLKCEVAA